MAYGVILGQTPPTIPSGLICMWSGQSNNIPEGWVLCDGNNNTPDLRNRFIVGVGDRYGVGNHGGEATHTLTIDEMPNHKHLTLRLSSTPQTNYATALRPVSNPQKTEFFDQGFISSTGGSQPHNNLPPYYALCFIMKI